MVSLYSLMAFFFILVIVYSVMAAALLFHGWCSKHRISRNQNTPYGALRLIDERTDRLKAKAFNIAVALVLFCITPFVILCFVVWP